jgi:hypothetical protein
MTTRADASAPLEKSTGAKVFQAEAPGRYLGQRP